MRQCETANLKRVVRIQHFPVALILEVAVCQPHLEHHLAAVTHEIEATRFVNRSGADVSMATRAAEDDRMPHVERYGGGAAPDHRNRECVRSLVITASRNDARW